MLLNDTHQHTPLNQHNNTRSTQKARFDSKMHGSTQKCPDDTKMPTLHASVDIAIIKYPPSCEKFFFSNFIQIFLFLRTIEKWKANYIDINSKIFNIIMKFEM